MEHHWSNLFQGDHYYDHQRHNHYYDDGDAKTTAAAAEEEEGVWAARMIPYSRHRDGTIFKNLWYWKSEYFWLDPTDRDETPVEPMRFSAPNADCWHDEPDDDCGYHKPFDMLQVFSLKLARAPPAPMNTTGAAEAGLVQLYGYIATRDAVDSKLNYVFRRSRDDPIAVPLPARQGSPIEMTGPKRGIALDT